MQSVKFYKVVFYNEYLPSRSLVHTFDRSPSPIKSTYEYSRIILDGTPFNYIVKKMFNNEVDYILVNKNLFETIGHTITKSSFFEIKVVEKLNNNVYNVEIYSTCHDKPNLLYTGKIEIEEENFLN